MKKVIFFLSVFILTSCRVKAQYPQNITNVQSIVWAGSSPTIGPCIWSINVIANTISTPCTPGISYTLPIATSSTLGGIKPDGTTLSVNPSTGVASVIGGSSYTLPIATNSVLGGIKPDGTTITVNPTTGIASSASAGSGPPNIYCVSTNSSGLIAQTINCNAFSYNANDFINYGGTTGGNNGITNMLAYCATLSPTTCYATISPTYTGTDVIPGYSLDYTISDQTQSTISANTVLVDQRLGLHTYLTNNWCALTFGNQCNAAVKQSIAWSSSGSTSANYFVDPGKYTIISGGCNYNSSAGTCISNYSPRFLNFYKYTSGQGILHALANHNYGPGDSLAFSWLNACYGGLTGAPTDEGCEHGDRITYQGGVQWAGTVNTGGVSPTTIIVSAPTQGAGTLAEQRELINQTTGVQTGTATLQVCSGDNSLTTPCTITTSASSFTPDTARGTAGTAGNIGAISLSPTFSVGSLSNFATNRLVCISDGYETERLYPTNVSGTLNFIYTKPHTAAAIITTGSSTCGGVFSFDADNVVNATFGVIPNGISQDPAYPTGGQVLIRGWKIIGSPASNQLMVAWQGKGSYRQITDNSSCCNSVTGAIVNGAFHIWPSATVSKINAGGISSGLNSGYNNVGNNVVQLANNNVTFNTNDVITELEGPAQQLSAGHDIISALFPSLITAPNSRTFDYYGIWHDSDMLLALVNHTPNNQYIESGGIYNYPQGILLPRTSYTFTAYQGTIGTFNLACTILCNNVNSPLARLSDTVGLENWYFNQVTGEIGFCVNNSTFCYWHKKDGLEIPVLADSAVTASDAGSIKIYYSSTQSCQAYVNSSGTKQCIGSGGGTNATSIQGNAVTAGSASVAGQAYVWNGSAFVLTQLNTLQNGIGSAVGNPSAGLQQINVLDIPRPVTITTDNLSTSDCGNSVMYENSGTTAVGVPTPTSTIMPSGCKITVTSWLNTTTLTLSTSFFFSMTGTSSHTTTVSAGTTKVYKVAADNNFYQFQ